MEFQEIINELTTKMNALDERLEVTKELNINEAFVNASLEFRQPKFTAEVKYGQTNFKYADLPEILDCVTEPLLRHGLCILHDFYNENGIHWLKTYLRYKNGETLGNIAFPIAITGKKMQEIGAQITYSKRYAIAMLCNLCADEDTDDGKAINDQVIIKKISEKQAKEIKDLMGNNASIWNVIKEQYNCNKISEILESQYNTIVTTIKLYNVKNGANNETL